MGVNGREKQNGAEVWQTYAMLFSLPFPQVDTVKLSISFANGTADDTADDTADVAGVGGRDGERSEFYVSEFSLTPVAAPGTDYPPAQPSAASPLLTVATDNLLPLGGRWFYAGKPGESAAPRQFDAANADRLLYHDAIYSAPFAGEVSAYLRPGMKNLSGAIVTQNTLVPDKRRHRVRRDIADRPHARRAEPSYRHFSRARLGQSQLRAGAAEHLLFFLSTRKRIRITPSPTKTTPTAPCTWARSVWR